MLIAVSTHHRRINRLTERLEGKTTSKGSFLHFLRQTILSASTLSPFFLFFLFVCFSLRGFLVA